MKNPSQLSTWNAVLWASVALMIGSLAFAQFYPSPRPKKTSTRKKIEIANTHSEIKKIRAQAVQDEELSSKYFWPGDAKRAEAEAMAMVTRIAKSHDVGLGAFRPQKTTEDSGLRRLPFSVSLEGTFTDVAKFLQELETPANRLAVRLVQISASDGKTNHVAASLGLIAFQKIETKAAAKRDSAPPVLKAPTNGPKTETSVRPSDQ